MAGPAKTQPGNTTKLQPNPSSASSMVSSRSVSDAGTEIVKEIAPHSKLALTRLTYQLEDLPDIYVVEVETFSDTSKTPPKFQDPERPPWAPINSQKWTNIDNCKVRYDALKELLAKDRMADIQDIVAINVGISRYTDHLILLRRGSDEGKKVDKAMEQGAVILDMKKTVNLESAERIEEAVKCEIMEGRLCKTDRHSELYWKSLSILMHSRATPIESESRFGIDSDFREAIPALGSLRHINPIGTIRGSKTAAYEPDRELDTSQKYPLALRKTLFLDKKESQLHINMDIIVEFPKQDLLRTFHDMWPGTTPDQDILANISAVRRFLRGLRVRCNYIPPSHADRLNGIKAQELENDDLKLGRVFQIKDIKMPSDIAEFEVPGFQGKYTVTKYFTEFILPETQNEYYHDKLPFVSDGQGHWIPMTCLVLDDPNTYLKAYHLHTQIKRRGRTLLEKGEQHMREYGNRFFKSFAHEKGDEKYKLFDAELEWDDVGYLQVDRIAQVFL